MAVETPRRRSYSARTSYSECGERFRLERVVRVPQRPAVWFAAGRAFHDTTEWYDRENFRADPAIVDASRRKLADVWAAKFGDHVEEMRGQEPDERFWRTAGRKTTEKPNGEDVTWWRENGPAMVAAYPDGMWSSLRLWSLPDGKPAIEVPILTSFGGVPVIQYIDRIGEEEETGALVVVDLKTGSTEPPFPVQLAEYAQGATFAFGRPIYWGAYYSARKGKLGEYQPLSAWTPEVLGEMYQQFDRAERSGLYLANVGRHCKTCGVRRWCRATGGQEYTAEAA
jgi:putative RecB family exonuclease